MIPDGGFVSAAVSDLEVDVENGSTSNLAIVVQYVLKDRASLTRYLREHAPRMRETAFAEFSAKEFSAQRRVLQERWIV